MIITNEAEIIEKGKVEKDSLIHGDCLKILPYVETDSVDCIICDPPFGTTGRKWDVIIPFEEMWLQLKRVIKPRGAIVLFANQPFTTLLIASNIQQFKYQWIWKKNVPTGFINAANAPLKSYEDICVFSDGTTANKSQNRMTYYPQGLIESNKIRKSKNSETDVWGTRPSRKNDGYRQKFSNYPKNILEFNSEKDTVHPTQKPLDLVKYLIMTYSKQEDVILDFTMGSGTTCLAAEMTDRFYIGIEKEKEYFDKVFPRFFDYNQKLIV